MKSPLLQKNGFWLHLGDESRSLYQRADATLDPIGMMLPIARAVQSWMMHPAEVYAVGSQIFQDATVLMQHAMARYQGESVQALVEPACFDRRFLDSAWQQEPFFQSLLEQYLYFSVAFERIFEETPAIDHKERRKAAFWFRKYANALAPTNFLATNPQAQKLAIESRGASLETGAQLFLSDLNTRTLPLTDLSAYKVGEDLAVTPGAVVARNELLEVVHYAPTTAKQRAVPIVLVTPWINKFYLVDLQPETSLVKHLLDEGFDVYVTSWRNPTAKMRDTTMDDYLCRGIGVAIDTALAVSGAREAHAVGYCIGGAALSMWMAIENVSAKKEQRPVRVGHWTTFATLVDYHYPGHIEVFIDPASVDYLAEVVAKTGYFEGDSMAAAFRLLRSNSLIWEVAVQRYLYGKQGRPNEILFWNMDSTRLPAAMYIWYLKELYLKNRLIIPNALQLCGTPINLGEIVQPTYIVAAEDDHIAPWRSVAHINKLIPASKRNVLSSSGHILGIINPPVPGSKRTYRVGNVETSDSMVEWESRSAVHEGSWWPDWFAWLHERTGDWVPARPAATAKFPSLGAAPGTYVHDQ